MQGKMRMSWSIGVLVAMNVALAFFLVRPHLGWRHGRRDQNLSREADHFIESQVGLSTDQKLRFGQLRERFRRESDALKARIRARRRELTLGLFDGGEPEGAAERVLDEVAVANRQLEALTRAHIRQVRDLCTAEQAPRLRALLEEALDAGDPQRRQR